MGEGNLQLGRLPPHVSLERDFRDNKETIVEKIVETSRERSREMGRPPCCDKVGVKKGPWTPEEDIILVSYIQEHGPGNWRSVPTNTGKLSLP